MFVSYSYFHFYNNSILNSLILLMKSIFCILWFFFCFSQKLNFESKHPITNCNHCGSCPSFLFLLFIFIPGRSGDLWWSCKLQLKAGRILSEPRCAHQCPWSPGAALQLQPGHFQWSNSELNIFVCFFFNPVWIKSCITTTWMTDKLQKRPAFMIIYGNTQWTVTNCIKM